MASTKYDKIFLDLKRKIEEGEYGFQTMLPSEYTLVEQYGCARNTLRRAIGELAVRGYVQSMHGKGVRIIYQPKQASQFSLGQIESFKEASIQNKQVTKTKVILFTELQVDQRMSKRTAFPLGSRVYYVQRVRYFNGEALIVDHNYFSQQIVHGLTKEICKNSIYEYIETVLKQEIVTTKRAVTVERVTELDEKYLALHDCNCVAVISSNTFNADGIMFEYTQSRHSPAHFVFYDQANRKKN